MAHARHLGVEVTRAVVANVNEQVAAVAVPLHAHPGDTGLLDQGEHGAAHDGPGFVGDLAGQRSPVHRRLDELYVEVAEAHERAQVIAQPFEGTHDGFLGEAAIEVAHRA